MVPVEFGLWYRLRSGRFGRYRNCFPCWIIGFLCFSLISYLHHVPPPVPWLDHVHLSSSQTVSCATLQIPDCITCSPTVPWLYHVLPSNSKTVSRATLQFPKFITCQQSHYFLLHYCITCPLPYIPFGDSWRSKLSLFHRLLLLLISH